MSEIVNVAAMAALRVSLFDCTKAPQEYLQAVEPKNALRRAWIPQTMADQVWVIYEFASEHERVDWERSLPPDVARWLDRKILAHTKKYG